MAKCMSFWKRLRASAYDPEMYRRIRREPFGKSVKYFLLFSGLVAAVFSLVILIRVGMFVYGGEATTFIQNVQSAYPQELEVTIDNGNVSTNVEEPYRIPMPEKWQEEAEMPSGERLENLVVIDTSSTVSKEAMERYDTGVLVGSDTIGYYSDNAGTVEIRSIGGVGKDKPVIINAASVESVTDTAWKFARTLGMLILAVVLPMFLFSGFVIGNALYLVFGALVIWLASRSRGAKYSYKESYKTGLTMISLPFAASALWMALPGAVLHIPFLRTIVLVIVAFANIAPETSPEAEEKHENSSGDQV